MNDIYQHAEEVLSDRMQWATVLLSRLVQRARREGWLEGEPSDQPLPEPEALEAAIERRIGGSPQDLTTFTMAWLAKKLRLSRRQLDTLWLLACIELSPLASRLAGAFAPDVTVQLLDQLVRVSSAELHALHARGLIEMATDARLPLSRRWVRPADRLVDLARGEIELDRALADICELLTPTQADLPIPGALRQAFVARPAPLIVAQGAEGSGRTTLLHQLASAHEVGILKVRLRALGTGDDLARQLRAIDRECALFSVVPLFCDGDATAVVAYDFDPARPVLVTAAAESRLATHRPLVVHQVATPTIEERERVWCSALPGGLTSVLREAAAQYTATPGTIVAAAAAASARAGSSAAVTSVDVHEGLRAHLDERLADLASRVTCSQQWTDLVLPADQFEQIIELIARVRHRRRVLEDWGFAEKVGRGTGIAALLSGPPGTGKTMVAGLIASELGLDLYQVDLSRIVSKYIGETEKNLARVFDAAESGHAILLFDEADALFAKRSEVKSSNDRYANLEVNFLLQRIEQFQGISLLTTNHERNIDEAFRRRLAMHVRFSAPDAEQREQLWRAMIPARAEVASDLDFRQLSEDLEMSGGYIKNAALRAAYLAAHEDSGITMGHLWRAARAEYEAMGKLARSQRSATS